jgi:hypothetical protein
MSRRTDTLQPRSCNIHNHLYPRAVLLLLWLDTIADDYKEDSIPSQNCTISIGFNYYYTLLSKLLHTSFYQNIFVDPLNSLEKMKGLFAILAGAGALTSILAAPLGKLHA